MFHVGIYHSLKMATSDHFQQTYYFDVGISSNLTDSDTQLEQITLYQLLTDQLITK